MSMLTGFTSALSGMKVSQSQIGIVSNNIANVDTPGYTRKTAQQSAVVLAGETAGVKLNQVERTVSESLLKSYLASNSTVGGIKVTGEYLSQLQTTLGTPEGQNSIAMNVSNLQEAFNNFSVDVTSAAGRYNLLNTAQTLTSRFNTLTTEIQKLRGNADMQISADVETINGLLDELDDLNDENDNGLFANMEKPGFVNYIYLSNTKIVSTLYTIIRGNILNTVNNVAPNDITILGYTTPLLREFDHYYRLLSHEKTKTMFEVPEIMYLSQLNYLKPDGEAWYKNLFNQLWKCNFNKEKKLEDWQKIKLKKYIASLLANSGLYNKYPDRLKNVLINPCKNFKINFEAFLAYLEHYKLEIGNFRSKVLNADYEFIRKNKKMNFWMNCGMIKISTIHSFKGWESKAVFLIVENEIAQTAFDELLYTGITRAKEYLVVINFGNEAYHQILKPAFDKVK